MTDRIQALFGLSGKRAVVTGGSRGIGAMITEGLVDAGAEVITTARKEDALRATADRINEAAGREAVTPIAGDLATPEGIAAFATEVSERRPELDILVNNAGASWGAPFGEYPVEGWDKVMDVNVRSVYYLTEALAPNLRAAGTADDPARVVNIGSVDGLRVPALEHFAYSASKAAVHQLTRVLAKRLVAEHVTVNAIAPGPFESKMMAWALADPDLRAAVAADVPMGRIGMPDDMAGAVIFLTSRAGTYLTGTVLPVAGGVACLE